jgi:signal transduction histidine kinase
LDSCCGYSCDNHPAEYNGWAQRDGKTIVVEGVAGEPELYVDPDLIQRLIGNLLSNALKHTSEGTTVRMIAQSSAAEVTLHVSDNRPGIPTELLPKLFSRYVRGSGHKEGGSSGLGLAFVRLAAEAHGGKVRVTSTPGIGTIFSVVLPIYANTPPAAADTQPPVDSQFNTVTTMQPLPTQT